MYNVQETQVPRISVDDPIVRHFGLEAGSVCGTMFMQMEMTSISN